MQVKELIISALNILGRGELAELLSVGGELDGEGLETVNTLVYCFNAVEDEIARKYLPLTAKEDLTSANGKFSYTNFSHSPVKIKSVLSGGAAVEYQLLPQYIAVNAKKITVEYGYAPSKKQLDGTSDFGAEAGSRMFALGMAAEYCLINGEIEAAELWEKKYRDAIDAAQSALTAGGVIPPRRWV